MASFCSQSAWEPGGPKHRTYMQFADGIYNLDLKSIFQLGIYFFIKNKKFLSYLGYSLHCLGVIASGYSVGLLSSYNISSGCCFVRLTFGS